jgi:hypothetical protein
MTGRIESCWRMIEFSDADRREDISRAVAFSAGGGGGRRLPELPAQLAPHASRHTEATSAERNFSAFTGLYKSWYALEPTSH